jgi:hypothetical protein
VCFGGIPTLPDSIEVDLVGYESFYGRIGYEYFYQPAALSGRYSLTRIPSTAVSIYDGQLVSYEYVSPFSFSIRFSCLLSFGVFYLTTAFTIGYRSAWNNTSESYMSSDSWTGSGAPVGFDPSPHPGWFKNRTGCTVENDCRIQGIENAPGNANDFRFNTAVPFTFSPSSAVTTAELSEGGVLPLLCMSELGAVFPNAYDSTFPFSQISGGNTYHYYRKSWSITAIDFIFAGTAIPAYLSGV